MRQKGVIMSQLFTTGRVVTELELRSSTKQNLYIHFTLVERLGYGENARSQAMSVWAWGHLAEQLKRFRVKKGSLIWVSGSLELEEYVQKDGVTRDKRLKLKLNDWGFVPKETDRFPKKEKAVPATSSTATETAGVIDGEREALPE